MGGRPKRHALLKAVCCAEFIQVQVLDDSTSFFSLSVFLRASLPGNNLIFVPASNHFVRRYVILTFEANVAFGAANLSRESLQFVR